MRQRSLFLFRLGVASVLLLSIGMLLPMLVPAVPYVLSGQAQLEPLMIMAVLLGIVAGATVLTTALLLRSASSPEGRALAMMLTAIAYAVGAMEMIHKIRQEWGLPWLVDALLDFTIPLALMIAVASLLRFTLLFPHPLTPAQLAEDRLLPGFRTKLLDSRFVWKWVIGIAVVAEGAVLATLAVRKHFDLAARGFPFHNLALTAILLVTLAICVANLRAGYRHSQAGGRRRIYWILEGLLAATVILVLASVLKLLQMVSGYHIDFTLWYPLAVLGGILVMIVFLGVAMFYAGALDPRLAIQRTATTGLVGVAMVLILAVAQEFAQELLVSILGLSDRMGGMVTGGVVALSFEPVQRRVSAFVSVALSRSGSGSVPCDVALVDHGVAVTGAR